MPFACHHSCSLTSFNRSTGAAPAAWLMLMMSIRLPLDRHFTQGVPNRPLLIHACHPARLVPLHMCSYAPHTYVLAPDSRVQTITYANRKPIFALLTAVLLNHSRRHCRSIATSSPVAQRWFNRALCQCFGFNHEEAIRCCSHALIADPDCLMAHW